MIFRVTVKDTRFSDQTRSHELDAPDAATAIFLAGSEFYGAIEYAEALEIVKVERPVAWEEVGLDG